MKLRFMQNVPLQEALTAMNEGFQDYAVNIQMDMEAFIQTLASKKLSPEYSFVAYDDDRPVGIILNSIQQIDGKKTSYNGGTAVHPDYRSKGVGRELIQKSVDLFNEKGVEVSTLEAISDNDGAIRLYERFGYKVCDRLSTLRMKFESTESSCTVHHVSIIEWKALGVEEEPVPWQNKVPFVDGREIYVIKEGEEAVGYAVLSKQPNKIMTLFQLQALDGFGHYDALLSALETHFAGWRVAAFNVPHQHPIYERYQSRENEPVIEQVWMKKEFNHG
ncbi:GNAT family N-acetyltransferase [Halobacillus litoralis]|uniref:GNAT family N-acetyltransferase n=1 Tax=Halobacillus litoralis TaxID=45668 RepID=UPI001CD32FA3|nr:GNAT family N-acetyltransferase [Halobacillus litoralis]MCA0972096.1 GNAT family N-acetyltransferase [Halobacillus litoralis]